MVAADFFFNLFYFFFFLISNLFGPLVTKEKCGRILKEKAGIPQRLVLSDQPSENQRKLALKETRQGARGV